MQILFSMGGMAIIPVSGEGMMVTSSTLMRRVSIPCALVYM